VPARGAGPRSWAGASHLFPGASPFAGTYRAPCCKGDSVSHKGSMISWIALSSSTQACTTDARRHCRLAEERRMQGEAQPNDEPSWHRHVVSSRRPSRCCQVVGCQQAGKHAGFGVPATSQPLREVPAIRRLRSVLRCCESDEEQVQLASEGRSALAGAGDRLGVADKSGVPGPPCAAGRQRPE
jgi:hypothetical protein